MADYLDSLIDRARGTALLLQPRVPALFEPVGPEQLPDPLPATGNDGPAGRSTAAPEVRPAAPLETLGSQPGPAPEDGGTAPPPVSAAAPPERPAPSPRACAPEARLAELEQRLDAAPRPVRLPAPEPLSRSVGSTASAAPEPGARPAATVHLDTAGLPPALEPAPPALQLPVPRHEMPDRTPDVVRVEHRLAETDRGLASIRPAASPAARIEPQVRLSAPPSSSVEALSPTAWPALSPRRLSQPGPSLPAREPGGEQMLVQVSIGRIEVRTPAPERPKPARADATGPMSLDEYLRRRNGIA